jgi:hypothetical protein
MIAVPNAKGEEKAHTKLRSISGQHLCSREIQPFSGNPATLQDLEPTSWRQEGSSP